MTAGTATASPTIAGLVLAAGESSRMGRDKALLSYRGQTFLEIIVAKLREAGISRVAVVLGHHADEIRRAVSLVGVEVVTNCDYLRGQTSSLQAGLAALDEWSLQREASALARTGAARRLSSALAQETEERIDSPGKTKRLEAFVLSLVDNPAFESSTVSSLIRAFARTAAPVVIPTYGGRRGHPVLIARPLFEPLLALTADQGANSVIRAWHNRTQLVEVADPGILVDVDDEEAYGALR
jgi:molybdenum cofactor cytidylyltransferase